MREREKEREREREREREGERERESVERERWEASVDSLRDFIIPTRNYVCSKLVISNASSLNEGQGLLKVSILHKGLDECRPHKSPST